MERNGRKDYREQQAKKHEESDGVAGKGGGRAKEQEAKGRAGSSKDGEQSRMQSSEVVAKRIESSKQSRKRHCMKATAGSWG